MNEWVEYGTQGTYTLSAQDAIQAAFVWDMYLTWVLWRDRYSKKLKEIQSEQDSQGHCGLYRLPDVSSR